MTTPPAKPAGRAPTPAVARWVLWSLIATVVALLLPFPWHLTSGLTGASCFIAGIVGLATLSRRGGASMTFMNSGAILLGGFTMIEALTGALLYDAFAQRARCLDGAITNTAIRLCEAEFEQAQKDRLAEFGVELPDAQ